MSVRQKFLRTVYPIWMWYGKIAGRHTRVLENSNRVPPRVSFYDLRATANDGTVIDFAGFKGKKVLLVNTASDCGYTGQYAQLEALHITHRKKLVVIGFPANDFKSQEKGTDEEIATFCKTNYNISFPLSKKSVVVKKPEQHPVFQWLTDPSLNGWCSQPPGWNFSKYLVTEQGILSVCFASAISPLDDVVLNAINTPG